MDLCCQWFVGEWYVGVTLADGTVGWFPKGRVPDGAPTFPLDSTFCPCCGGGLAPEVADDRHSSRS